jgi:hypothetical protein
MTYPGGNMLSRHTRADQAIVFTYDTLNRPATKTPPSPAPVVSKCSPDERSDIRVLTSEPTPAGRYAIAGEAHESAMRHPGSFSTLTIA